MSHSARHILRSLTSGRTLTARNSLLNNKPEALSLRHSDVFKWYSCGPTVYDDAHLGHARAYVSFDILRRIITSLSGVSIEYALGVTDIDDKILQRANERSIPPSQLASFYESRFFEDMHALNIMPPNKILRVTEHIADLIAFIEQLIQSGAAYTSAAGNVYFAVGTSGDRYCQLDPSRRLTEDYTPPPVSSIATNITSEKRDPRDFALWKTTDASINDASVWDSPWGRGRPGWHVECSAMSMAALGPYLDLHTGGIDLRFPHHTNELATAEAKLCIHQLPNIDTAGFDRWCNTWLHAGHLHLQGRKMSKSLKNFISVREFLKQGGTADSFRTFCLLHKYSSPLEYSEDRLEDAKSYLSRMRRFATRDVLGGCLFPTERKGRREQVSLHPNCAVAASLGKEVALAKDDIENALANDFDTPRAMSKLAHIASVANTTLDNEGNCRSGAAALAYHSATQVVQNTLTMLGISNRIFSAETERGDVSEDVTNKMTSSYVNFRSAIRNAAKSKDLRTIFELCDQSRAELESKFGVRVEDKKSGLSTWSRE